MSSTHCLRFYIFIIFYQLILFSSWLDISKELQVYVALCDAPCDMDSGNSGDNWTDCHTYCTYAGSMVLLAKLCSIRRPPLLLVLVLGYGKKCSAFWVFANQRLKLFLSFYSAFTQTHRFSKVFYGNMHYTQQTHRPTNKLHQLLQTNARIHVNQKQILKENLLEIRFDWTWCGNLKHFMHASSRLIDIHLIRAHQFADNHMHTHTISSNVHYSNTSAKKLCMQLILSFAHRYLRIRHRQLQALVFQCNWKHMQNLGADGCCSNHIVRMCKVFDRPNDHQVRALLHDIPVLFVNIFTLLRLVGLCKLLQRRLLQPMESPNVFYGKFRFTTSLVKEPRESVES